MAQASEALIAGMRSGSIRARGGKVFKPSTIRSYEAALRDRIVPAIGARRLSDVLRGDLRTIAERMLGEGLDASSVRNAIMPLRVIYRRELEAGTVTINPAAGLALPAPAGRRDRIATPTEAAALLGALPDRDRALWATALLAGLRAGEIGALRWDDVDLSQGLIYVRRSCCPKSRTTVERKSSAGRRAVPMIGPLRAILLEDRLATGRRDGLVCGGAGTVPFNHSGLCARSECAWKAAAFPPLACDVAAHERDARPLPEHGYLTLHEGRHTHCSTLLAAGVSPAAVSRYAGHASVAFTMARYVKALAGTEASDAAKVEALLAGAGA